MPCHVDPTPTVPMAAIMAQITKRNKTTARLSSSEKLLRPPYVGTLLGKHYSNALLDSGFQCILGWECLYFHAQLHVILSVYVDDFKFAGRKESLAQAWQLMRDNGLKLDLPEPFKEYLGCGQHTISLIAKEVQQRLEHIHPIRVDPDLPSAQQDVSKRSANIPIRAIAYDMRCFFQQVVDKYFQFFL